MRYAKKRVDYDRRIPFFLWIGEQAGSAIDTFFYGYESNKIKRRIGRMLHVAWICERLWYPYRSAISFTHSRDESSEDRVRRMYGIKDRELEPGSEEWLREMLVISILVQEEKKQNTSFSFLKKETT